jgi:hypothetical protein
MLLAEVYPTLPSPPLQEDEDLSAAKRSRLEAPTSISYAEDGVVYEHTATDSSPDDTPVYLVTPAASLPNATPFRTPRISWKPEEDAKLTEAVKKYGKNWGSVSKMVLDRTNQQCRGRWLNILDPANESKDKARTSWKPEEDTQLMEAVKKHGTDWLAVAAMVPDRTNQMCRQRWINTLDPANEKNTGQMDTRRRRKTDGSGTETRQRLDLSCCNDSRSNKSAMSSTMDQYSGSCECEELG